MKKIKFILYSVLGHYYETIRRLLGYDYIENLFNTKYEQKALVCYLTHPFRGMNNSHSNYLESKFIADVFNELEYQVDIIQFNSNRDVNFLNYNIIFGFGPAFEKSFKIRNDNTVKRIFYSTGTSFIFQNIEAFNRLLDFRSKYGLYLFDSVRIVNDSTLLPIKLSDGIITLTKFSKQTFYPYYSNQKICSIPLPFHEIWNPHEIIKNKTKNFQYHFLWLGSSGLIHKGLDILLEYFYSRPDLTLHIVGNLNGEKEFTQVFNKELSANNIKTYGYLSIDSDLFNKILKQCGSVIFPSCAEGGGGAVITAIGNGGLVPIVTNAVGVDTGNGIIIENISISGIKTAVEKILLIDNVEFKKIMILNANYIIDKYSEINFKNLLKEFLLEL